MRDEKRKNILEEGLEVCESVADKMVNMIGRQLTLCFRRV